VLAGAACSPTVDLGTNLEVVDASTGWADAGLTEDGQNKLVPFVRFKLKNNSAQSLPVLQVNAMFLKLDDEKEWGSRFMPVTGSEGLSSGQTSKEITLKSDHGLTGTDPRADMMKSSHFVEARVRLTAKYGSVQWVKMAEYPVKRVLVE
jgi:hypothetical protein